MFSDKECERLKELANLYVQAKMLIIYVEEADPDARSNIQIIKELRDAFDHVMRVIVAHTEPSKARDSDYGEKNLHKAIGHLYRATFDALDGTTLSLREKIVDLLSPYSTSVILEVIPEYWDSRVKLEELTSKVAENRAKKDVGDNVGEVLDTYMEDVENLKAFYNRALNSMSAIEECTANQKRDKFWHWTTTFLISVLSAAISAGIAWFLSSP